jgi:hypothetical protein
MISNPKSVDNSALKGYKLIINPKLPMTLLLKTDENTTLT